MGSTKFTLKEYGKKPLIKRLSRWRGSLAMGCPELSKKSCEQALRLAKAWAPVFPKRSAREQKETHPELRAGALRDSLFCERLGRKEGYVLGSTSPYAAYVEFGADHPGVPAGTPVFFYSRREGRFIWTDQGIEAHRIAGQPFMRPAFHYIEDEHFKNVCLHLPGLLRRYGAIK